MKKFNYGNFHTKYDMSGEINIGTGIIKVHDIFEGLPEFMLEADCVFVDPPCSKGNLKAFYTKAEIEAERTFDEFNKVLFNLIEKINPLYLFVEVFKSNKEVVYNYIKSKYTNISQTKSYYYNDKSKVCWILQGTNSNLIKIPYVDEQYIIEHICSKHDFKCIADPCMGRGLVGYYANKYKKKFVGTELNEKRLAVLMERITRGRI